jgi:RNA polymerase sigma-B factor
VALRFSATPLRRSVWRERLVADYWYLCRRAARRFKRRGLEPADLEQVGAIGLIKAVDRYDASQSAPFEAYAWLLVVGELMHYVRDCSRFVRAPRTVRERERRWSAAERKLYEALGREASEREVAQFLGTSAAQAGEVRAYRASGQVLSVEVLGRSEKPTPGGEIDDLIDRLTVDRMLSVLSPVQRRIVVAIHLEHASVVEVAARMGYSRRHVTRLHRVALERLRSTCEVPASRDAEARSDVSLPHCGRVARPRVGGNPGRDTSAPTDRR